MGAITPGLRTRAGLEVHRLLHKQEIAEHRLHTLFWECTLRCNLQCRHCGSDCHVSANSKDMPVADFLKVVDSITPHVDPHKVFVIFTGGEALVRKDLELCGKALYDRGYPWGVVTNGMLLDRRRLDSLLACGMHCITVSLDGFEADHNWMRGNPQSFARASASLKMLAAEEEIVWDVVTCANQRNLDTLEEFSKYLISQGVTLWRIFTVFPAGRAAQDDQMQLTDRQFLELMNFIERIRKEGRIKVDYGCEGFLGSYETRVRDGFYRCMAGVNVASVLSDGSISGCPSIRSDFHQGNIYNDSFMDVWNTRFAEFRDRKWAKKGECASCDMFRYCLGGGMHLRGQDKTLMRCHYHRLHSDR